MFSRVFGGRFILEFSCSFFHCLKMYSTASPSVSPLTPTQLIDEILMTKADKPDFDLSRLSAQIDAVLAVYRKGLRRRVKLDELLWASKFLTFEDQVSPIVERISKVIKEYSENNNERIIKVLNAIGNVHWFGVAFLVMGTALKITKNIDKECIMHFEFMNNLSKMILQFQDIPIVKMGSDATAINKSIQLIMEGAILRYKRDELRQHMRRLLKMGNMLHMFYFETTHLLSLASKTLSATERRRERMLQDLLRHREVLADSLISIGRAYEPWLDDSFLYEGVETESRSFEHWLGGSSTSTPQQHEREAGIATICRVRQGLRKLQPEAYDPEIVELGFFQDGSKMWGEKMQTLCITADRLKYDTFQDLVANIKTLSLDLRNCYEGINVLFEKDLACNFAMDACFILEFFRSLYWFPDQTEIMKDIFKLENQIPLLTLIAILEMEFQTRKEAISKLADMLCMHPQIAILPFSLKPMELEILQAEVKKNIEEKPCHLLHLLSKSIEAFLRPLDNPPDGRDMDIDADVVNNSINFMFAVLKGDADIVQEFQIRFQPSKDGKIQFKKGWFGNAVLYLPQIYLYKETESVWWNLIAFAVDSESNIIGHFISFMKYIVSLNRKNVALLKKNHIIMSERSNDELYAMFDGLSEVIKEDCGPFKIVQRQVTEHCNNPLEWIVWFTSRMIWFLIIAFCVFFFITMIRLWQPAYCLCIDNTIEVVF